MFISVNGRNTRFSLIKISTVFYRALDRANFVLFSTSVNVQRDYNYIVNVSFFLSPTTQARFLYYW